MSSMLGSVTGSVSGKGHGGEPARDIKAKLPAKFAKLVSETEAKALVHMLAGSNVLIAPSGGRPRQHFLQVSDDFSVLRWSWKGYVLMHEVIGMQLLHDDA